MWTNKRRYFIRLYIIGYRVTVEWGEAVEGLSAAVVDNRVHGDCADVRRTSEFLAHRILRSLLIEMKAEKQKRVRGSIYFFEMIFSVH